MSYPHPPATTMAAMHRPAAFPPSPPNSVPRPSNGNGPMAAHATPDGGKHAIHILDEQLHEHHRTLTKFLAATASEDQADAEPHYRARDKLLRLSSVQFQELSIDVYDELLRREHDRRHPPHPADTNHPRFLLPRPQFHPKRNQARQKLATLATHKFRELVGDVLFELERRHPRFAGLKYSPATNGHGSHPPGQRGPARTPSGSRSMRQPSNPNLRQPPSTTALRPQQSTPSLRTRARADSRTGPRTAPPPLPAYVQGLRRPSINNSPNPLSSNSTSPTGPYSPASDGYYQNLPIPYRQNDYGRPLPNDFQTPPSAKSKVSAAERFDEANDGNASESDYGADVPSRTSHRHTNKSLPFSMEPETSPETQAQISNLMHKVTELESQLRLKNEELSQSQNHEAEFKQALEDERKRSSALAADLQGRLSSAERLNAALQSEVDALTASNTRIQVLQHDHKCEWKTRFDNLKQDYDDQQALVDQVRQEAVQNLHEMRSIADQTVQATDREDKLMQQITQLQGSVTDWKGRYTKAKAQLRNLRAVSMAYLPGAANAGMLAKDGSLTDPHGLVKDVSITQYQMAVDELLQLTHSSDPSAVLDYMRTIVASVRAVTEEVDSAAVVSARASNANSISSAATGLTSTSSSTGADSDSTATVTTNRHHSKLRARISAAANNLITAAKNFSAGGGISPASLVDAAASNLTAAVVDLVKEVKVRPTPRGELEHDLELELGSEPGPEVRSARDDALVALGGEARR